MDLQLNDKRALVTGGTSGLGAEIARMLAQEGVKVVVHGRNRDRAQAVIDEIEAKGGQAAAALGDLMTADGAQAVIKAAEQAFGIDILVNNAGGSDSDNASPWFEVSVEEHPTGGAAGPSLCPGHLAGQRNRS
jgi:3-oxoacyl-[acyl-carrier protein] reductase